MPTFEVWIHLGNNFGTRHLRIPEFFGDYEGVWVNYLLNYIEDNANPRTEFGDDLLTVTAPRKPATLGMENRYKKTMVDDVIVFRNRGIGANDVYVTFHEPGTSNFPPGGSPNFGVPFKPIPFKGQPRPAPAPAPAPAAAPPAPAAPPPPPPAAPANPCDAILREAGIVGSTAREVRKNFNRWSLRNHPDKGGDEARFKEVSGCVTDIDTNGGRSRRKGRKRTRRRRMTRRR